MFRAKPALAPTSAHTISESTIAQLLRRRISTLNPLEPALPQNRILHSANPIESTPFFQIAQFRTNSVPVTPAYTTLTKHTPRNPIRMNTSAKHQVAPHPEHLATNSSKTIYVKTNTTRSYHSTHNSAQISQPRATALIPQLNFVARAATLAALWYTFTSR